MMRVIPYFCCIILFYCIRNGWSNQHGEIRITDQAGRTKQTGYSGDSLIIGSATRDKRPLLPGEKPISYSCARLGNDAYEKQYETKVLKGPSRHSKVGQSAKEIGNKAVDSSDHFIHVRKEVWSCHLTSQMENHNGKLWVFDDLNLNYLRIVNEMVSFKEIYDVEYYAGVDVSLVNYFENEIRIKVKETKCLAWRGDEQFKQVQCEPDTIYKNEKNIDSLLPNLAEQLVMSEKENHRELDIDKKDASVSVREKYIKTISDKGVSLKIGSILKTERLHKLDNKGKYDCYPKQGVSPLLFTPEIYQKIDIGTFGISYAKITHEYFSEVFTIVDRQVHECRFNTKTRGVYRVLNTIIGKTEIQDVIDESGILKLYVISLPDGGKSIRFTTVEFFYVDTRERVADDDVYYKINSFKERRSTWSYSNKRDPLPDIVNKLGDRTVFRTLINPEGFNLRVGSEIVKTIGQGSQVQCTTNAQNQYLDEFNTVLKLNVVEDDAFHTQVIDDHRIPIEYTSKEFWLCTNKKGNMKFHRIVNILKLPADLPVHEIETFDGVEIQVEPLDDGRKSVDIVEVKYMDFQKNAVFYEGYMEFQSEEVFTSFEASQQPNAVSKNEIFPLIDDMPIRKHNSKDPFVKDGDEKRIFVVRTRGYTKIDFTVKPQNQEEPSTQSLYLCKLEGKRILLPYFGLITEDDQDMDDQKKNVQKKDALDDAQDCTKNSKFFENMNNKVWTCKYGDYWFYRVVNKQSFRKTIKFVSQIYHTDMDKVWLEMTSNNEYVVKMEGVRHAKIINSETQYYPNLKDNYLINSEGHFMLFEEKPRTGAWKSGTQELKQETNSKPIKSKIVENIIEMKETDYNLDAGRMYKVPFSRNRKVNKDNPSLRIGSKWSIHETVVANLWCKEVKTSKPEPTTEKEFLTKVVSVRKGIAFSEDAFQDFFMSQSQRTWNCSTSVKSFILRVMNIFKFIHNKLDQVNDIFYYDGVTVVSEKDGDIETLEMIEVKYLDSKTKEVVRFDGIREVFDAVKEPDHNEKIIPERLKSPAIVDVEYNLNDNEIYRSDISVKGAILEVGQRYESNYGEQTGRNVRFLRIKCNKEQSDVEEVLLKDSAFHPKLVIFRESEKDPVQFHPVGMDDKTFQEYFQKQEVEVWWCLDIDDKNSERFHRVVSRLTMSDKLKNSISHVYYYDGVTIYNKQVIEEIKYLSKDGQGKYHVMRLDGFVATDDKIGLRAMRDYNRQGENFEEIVYFPFRRVLCNTNMQKGDVTTYEVQSHWDVEIKNDDNDIITCIKKDNPEIDKFCEIEIYGFSAAENLDKPNKFNKICKEENFLIQEQDIWDCERNGKLIFKRYVNKLYKKDLTTVHVYDPAGVSVEVGKLPDNTEFLQITQVKFLDADSRARVKYVGKLKLVSEVVPGAENFLINYSFKKESRGLGPSNVPYWPLDILRVYTIFISSYTTTTIMAVKYNEDRDALKTTMVNDKAERVFKIGRPWEEEITESKGEFKCILDKWNSNDIFEYMPRVVEYVDDSLYQLDNIAFHGVFKKIKIDVYICTNKWDKFLRLESVFQGKIPILAVRYGDGVDVEIIKEKNGKQVKITETIYMNFRASKVLKFVEDPQIIITPSELSGFAKAGKKITGSLTTIGTKIGAAIGPKCG